MMYVIPTNEGMIVLVESNPFDFLLGAFIFIVCKVHIWVLGEINFLACHLRIF